MKRPKLTPLCGPRGVWTPPRGLSTAIFGDSLQDLTKKRADVDMWTVVSLLIIERRGVHISWGALGGAGPCKDSRRSTLLRPPLNLGEPFWCPRSACLKYGWMEVLQSSVGVDSVIGWNLSKPKKDKWTSANWQNRYVQKLRRHSVDYCLFFIFVDFFGSRDKVGVCSSIRGDRVDAC